MERPSLLKQRKAPSPSDSVSPVDSFSQAPHLTSSAASPFSHSRVTRSAARLSSSSSTSQPNQSTSTSPQPKAGTNKRKASSTRSAHRGENGEPPLSTPRKRQKTELDDSPPTRRSSRRGKAVMADDISGGSTEPKAEAIRNETGPSKSPETTTPAPRRKSSRTKKPSQPPAEPTTSTTPSKRSKKAPPVLPDEDVQMPDADLDKSDDDQEEPMEDDSEDDDDDDEDDEDDDDDEDEELPGDYNGNDMMDPFEARYYGAGRPPHGASSHLRALSNIMSGMHSRLRELLANLRQKDDPTIQLIALTQLSELLLVSTEDNLSGAFAPDQFVREFVTLLQPPEFGEENPEMMLLACRCIANLMEAMPAATASVVYGGAVPVLCQKLLEIHYIDLAEQALSTLEKISIEYPSSIVREGGLTACLTYLDFFATSTQRTAVTTAANCCRNLSESSFSTVRDIMPILLNVLGSNDQKVVEQGCLCVSRIVESFRHQPGKLEELVSKELLQAILRLLLPGATNMIGPNIHTQFLKVLAYTARSSPKLSLELFKMNIVDTIYQILTGTSPPSETTNIMSKLDSVVIMQALIHRPREHIYETLNVICELLPSVPKEFTNSLYDPINDVILDGLSSYNHRSEPAKSSDDVRRELLRSCKAEMKRFAVILLPTLTDAYSSTVNLPVRQRVLRAQINMISNLEVDILEEALRFVPYASYLASILSQQDDPSLVTAALQAAELLLKRLGGIYRYQFYREGVIAEISKLASGPVDEEAIKALRQNALGANATKDDVEDIELGDDVHIEENLEDEEGEDDEVDEDEGGSVGIIEENEDHDDNLSGSISSDDSSSSSRRSGKHNSFPGAQQFITLRAKQFLEAHEADPQDAEMKKKATGILEELERLASQIEAAYTTSQPSVDSLFSQLAEYFHGDSVESVSSYELLNSGVLRVLLDLFNNADKDISNDARTKFLRIFISSTTKGSSTRPNPFSVLTTKLQDLLSRAEHFEVFTVHSNALDGGRSSPASMLAKQLRLKLEADEDSEIPRSYRNILVSIHAIATFKALDDYLRPRIRATPRQRSERRGEALSSRLAAIAAAAGLPNPNLLLSSGRLPGPPGGIPAALAEQSTPKSSRSTRKSNRNRSESTSPADENSPSADRTPSRRSSRKHQLDPLPPPSNGLPKPTSPPAETQENPLECADERPISEGEAADDLDAMNAIVDNLDSDIAEPTADDPGAVNMEIAATGRVTARREDGTRVSTPSQTSGLAPRPPVTPASGAPSPSPLSSASRASNRPSQSSSTPQEWHIEFSINGNPISNESTIYRAVHLNKDATQVEPIQRSSWSSVHTIKFKRVPGPPPPTANALVPPHEPTELTEAGIPKSLDSNPISSTILQLLSILHSLNSDVDVLIEDASLKPEPLSQFVNTKLTAKLNRQLEEPLIVASNCLPAWAEDLTNFYPFLFPFETRHLFLQSTSFGYSRSMSRWQNSQSANDSRPDRHRDDARSLMGRLQRQKVRISRSRILESAVKVLELYGASPSVLEVEYFDEVGTGLGPTLEFYSSVSKEFSKRKLKLWRENETSGNDEYAFGKRGLFPAPISASEMDTENGKKILQLFKMLGKFVARSMLDSRIIDIPFNPAFFRLANGQPLTHSLVSVSLVDDDLAKSLKLLKKFATQKIALEHDDTLDAKQKQNMIANITVDGASIDDLGLDFTLPGYPLIDLLPNGSNIAVTIENVAEYLEKVIDLTLGSGVQKQVEAFQAGFSLVFPYDSLKAFTPDELVMLFGRVTEDWSIETLTDAIKADHGYNLDSKSVRNLLQVMTSFSPSERREFLQFVTGSPKLPIGGFKSLTPMFTVVCKPSEQPYTSDDYLPSVMTCVNYLKLPDYSNVDILRQKLNIAMCEGQGAFHLS